jgi:hypothetical protein
MSKNKEQASRQKTEKGQKFLLKTSSLPIPSGVEGWDINSLNKNESSIQIAALAVTNSQ